MSKEINKENTKGNVNENQELKEDEVNGFCSCTNQDKMHCNHDCLGGGSLISKAQ